mmetsp:Transcript_63101/g.150422  ORF Transcript_63101/g.150422 Transcript_63101/m.150422 type:complete len:336 (+) Transcript_63101:131-1138(+)
MKAVARPLAFTLGWFSATTWALKAEVEVSPNGLTRFTDASMLRREQGKLSEKEHELLLEVQQEQEDARAADVADVPKDPEGLVWRGQEPFIPKPHSGHKHQASKADTLTSAGMKVVDHSHQRHHDDSSQGASRSTNDTVAVETVTVVPPTETTEVPPSDPEGVETEGEEPIKPQHAVERATEETEKAKEAADKAQEFANQANVQNVVQERVTSWCQAMSQPEMKKEMEGDAHRKCEFVKLCEGGAHKDWCLCMQGFGLTGGPRCKAFISTTTMEPVVAVTEEASTPVATEVVASTTEAETAETATQVATSSTVAPSDTTLTQVATSTVEPINASF